MKFGCKNCKYRNTPHCYPKCNNYPPDPLTPHTLAELLELDNEAYVTEVTNQ